jgi:hypothetical protein
MEHVAQRNKFVLNAGSQLDLRSSIGYAIWTAQGFPAAATGITAAHVTAALVRVKELVQLYEFVALCNCTFKCNPDGTIPPVAAPPEWFAAPGVRRPEFAGHVLRAGAFAPERRLTVTFRASDCLTPAAWAAVDGRERLAVAADKLWVYLRDPDHPDRLEYLYGDSDFLVYALGAVQFHREGSGQVSGVGGHSWFTPDQRNPESLTGRAQGVAGVRKQAFSAWICAEDLNRGHDYVHCFPDPDLKVVVYAAIGPRAAGFSGTYFVAHQVSDGAGGMVDVQYGGMQVAAPGVLFHDLLQVGDAMRDRLPFGTTGVAALAVGLSYVARMISIVSMKVQMDQGANAIAATEVLRKYILSAGLDRDRLLAVKNDCGSLLGMAYGYAAADVTNAEELDKHAAFKTFALKNQVNVGVGKELYKALIEVEVDPTAVAAVIGGALNGLRAVINNLTASLGVNGDADAFVDPAAATERPVAFAAVDVDSVRVGMTANQVRERNKEAELRIRAAEAGVVL